MLENTKNVSGSINHREFCDNIIIVRNMAKIFRGHREIVAVCNLSFEIHNNEIFGLVGPNGAGKTTIIRILSTLLQPTTGDVCVKGYDIRKHSDKIREIIGICPQQSTLDNNLTAWENLEFHGKLFNMERQARLESIDTLLHMAELEKWMDIPVRKFSRGMKRRLEIVRAFMHQPKILFLDEPTTGLDPESRLKIWQYLKALNSGGVTIVLTTHNMQEAESLCHRIAIFNKGRIIALGSPQSLKKSLVRGEIIEVHYEGDSDNLIHELAVVPGVFGIDDNNGIIKIAVENGIRLLPSIIKILITSAIAIHELSLHTKTLDDAYIYYVKDDGQ